MSAPLFVGSIAAALGICAGVFASGLKRDGSGMRVFLISCLFVELVFLFGWWIGSQA